MFGIITYSIADFRFLLKEETTIPFIPEIGKSFINNFGLFESRSTGISSEFPDEVFFINAKNSVKFLELEKELINDTFKVKCIYRRLYVNKSNPLLTRFEIAFKFTSKIKNINYFKDFTKLIDTILGKSILVKKYNADFVNSNFLNLGNLIADLFIKSTSKNIIKNKNSDSKLGEQSGVCFYFDLGKLFETSEFEVKTQRKINLIKEENKIFLYLHKHKNKEFPVIINSNLLQGTSPKKYLRLTIVKLVSELFNSKSIIRKTLIKNSLDESSHRYLKMIINRSLYSINRYSRRFEKVAYEAFFFLFKNELKTLKKSIELANVKNNKVETSIYDIKYKELSELISKVEITEAIKMLEDFTIDGDVKLDLTLIKMRYNNNRLDLTNGIITREKYNVELTRLTKSILEIGKLILR